MIYMWTTLRVHFSTYLVSKILTILRVQGCLSECPGSELSADLDQANPREASILDGLTEQAVSLGVATGTLNLKWRIL